MYYRTCVLTLTVMVVFSLECEPSRSFIEGCYMCKSVSCLHYSKHYILGEAHRMGPFKDHQEQKQCIMRWNIPNMNLDGTIFVKCSHTPSQQNLSPKETTTTLNGNVKPNYFWENVEWIEVSVEQLWIVWRVNVLSHPPPSFRLTHLVQK